MSEVFVVVAGGLGNQLFQAAFGVAIRDRFGARVRFLTDYFQYDPYERRLLLPQFPALGFEPASQADVSGGALAREGAFEPSAIEALIPAYPRLVFEGYWQAERWFLGCETAIRAAFALDPVAELRAKAEGLRQAQTIGLHVRRSDYGHHGLAAVDYYLKAIEAIRAEIGPVPIACFTDEPNFCRFVFRDVPDLTVAPSNILDPIDDFYLLSACTHFIIANSSFSWWAAWLGRTDGSIVYAPSPWNLVDSSVDPIPPSWRRIEGVVRAP
jgi:hypothetical protein